MKITDVQICRVTLPTDRWLLVCVETDEGHRGWGEVTGSMDDHGLWRKDGRRGRWAGMRR